MAKEYRYRIYVGQRPLPTVDIKSIEAAHFWIMDDARNRALIQNEDALKIVLQQADVTGQVAEFDFRMPLYTVERYESEDWSNLDVGA